MKRTLGLAALGRLLACGTASAQQINVKIGVLTDMSSLYADVGGPGSVAAAKLAIADFTKANPNVKVELVSGDHQNKPDVGSQIANQWFDVDKVDAIVDVPNSGVALAVSQVTNQKNKVFLVSGAATSDLTGPKCNANTVHWTYDTWMLANGTGKAMVKTGGDTWFFLTADYAFGHALERDTTAAVVKPAARCSATCATRSTPTTSRPSCCRRRPPRPRSSGSPMPAATPSTPSSRAPSSASSRAGRSSPACWCS